MAKSFNACMKDRFLNISTNMQKMNEYIHETAVMIIEHAKEHGDCSTAQGLVMAMPASMRREMLILWFTKFTPIVVKNAEEWASKMHKPESKLFVEWDIDEAKAKPFYELAKENPEAAPLDFEGLLKLVTGLANRIQKKAEAGEVAPEDMPTALAISDRLLKLKFQRVVPANDENDVKEEQAA